MSANQERSQSRPNEDEQHQARIAKIEAARRKREADRDRLRTRLLSEDGHDLAAMLDKCGQTIRLACSSCGHRHDAETRCKKRWCPSCAFYIAAERVSKYAAAAARFKWPLFVTLTMRNTITPDGLREMKKAWSSMRRRKIIASRVRSGIVGFEVTNKGQGWHPHCHALLDCEWLAIKVPPPSRKDRAEVKADKCRAAAEELSRTWAKAVGQPSASVHIRRADARALVEVLKYSVKGTDLIESKDSASDLIRVMQGMRLITTFGAIRKEMQDEDPEADEEPPAGRPCEQCGETGTLIPVEIMDAMLRRAFDSVRS